MIRTLHGLLPGTGIVRVVVRDGVVAEVIEDEAHTTWDDRARSLPLLLPGLLDLQVNGYAGVDFTDPGLDELGVHTVVEAMWRAGVTGFCPTVITGALADCLASLRTLRAAAHDPEIASTVLGVHLEGPWISPADGARGAHPREHVRDPDLAELRQMREAGDIAMITVAPERPGALDLIRAGAEAGIVMSIGHSSADPSDVRNGVAAGACASTHLGNGVPLMLPRHPNLVWEQLSASQLTPMFIADGHHVDLTTLRTLVRAASSPGWVLVSDVTSIGGLPAGRYRTRIGGHVELSPAGRLGMVDNGFLAGSATALPVGLLNALETGIGTADQALRSVTAEPARLIGERARDRGQLRPGARADLVRAHLADTPGPVVVDETIIGGRTVWSGS